MTPAQAARQAVRAGNGEYAEMAGGDQGDGTLAQRASDAARSADADLVVEHLFDASYDRPTQWGGPRMDLEQVASLVADRRFADDPQADADNAAFWGRMRAEAELVARAAERVASFGGDEVRVKLWAGEVRMEAAAKCVNCGRWRQWGGFPAGLCPACENWDALARTDKHRIPACVWGIDERGLRFDRCMTQPLEAGDVWNTGDDECGEWTRTVANAIQHVNGGLRVPAHPVLLGDVVDTLRKADKAAHGATRSRADYMAMVGKALDVCRLEMFVTADGRYAIGQA